ncbi:tripartite tricarboxylate transporter substrate binding protein [Streptosporangium sp. NPDC002544]|uniref:Bug family tripartite tricarboxylate transporter substrate binding protein n=1 Tax=unclassified Streptosporangium TaxID=2632669 RepID=UPI00332C40CA
MGFSLTRSSKSAGVAAALVTALSLTACSSAGDAGDASSYPSKVVEMVVPYAAGGPTDISARALAKGLKKSLGVNAIVVNRPGASGITGTAEVATGAKKDGYTILYNTGDAFVQSTIRSAPYNFDSFTPVAGVISQPYLLVTSAKSGLKSFADLAKGKDLTYAVSGIGTPTHLNTAMLFDGLGVKSTAVPYDGAGPAVQALVGNQTDLGMLDASVTMPFVTSGDLVPLAVFTPDGKKLDYVDAPTLQEAGVDVSSMTSSVWGVAVPAGTPDEVVKKLREATLTAAQDTEFVTFTEKNYMPRLEGDNELNWYADLKTTSETTKAALAKFSIELK